MHFEPLGILMRLIQGLQFKKHQPTGNGLDTVGTRLLSLPLVLLPQAHRYRILLHDAGRLSPRPCTVHLHSFFFHLKGEKNI